MISALVSGSLIKDPIERTAANGRPYATAAMRVPAEDADAIIASIITFSEPAVEALLALRKGDALAVAGRASLRTWEKDGETKTGLSITADRVLTAYAAGKSRKQTREAEAAA